MITVTELELEQKISEFIVFIKDYTANKKGDFKIKSKRDKALLTCVDRDITLDFTV